jgi:hypothetical protein
MIDEADLAARSFCDCPILASTIVALEARGETG